MAGNSLTDIAYQNLKRKKKEIVFNKLWQEVCEEMGYTEEMGKRKISSFYNALMLDARFISLEKNTWDLRERYAEDTLKIDPDLVDDYDEFDEDDYVEEELVIESDM